MNKKQRLHLKGYAFDTRRCHFRSQKSVLCMGNDLPEELHDILKSPLHLSSSELVSLGYQVYPAVFIGLLLLLSESWILDVPMAFSFHSMFLAIKSNWYMGISRLNHFVDRKQKDPNIF